MWWLIVALTAACILLFAAVTFGDFIQIAILSAFWCVLPTPIIVFAIYARGDLQAFAIGALVPWVILLALRFFETLNLISAAIWLLPMSAICGTVAAATRRWIEANLRR
jgi:hypothetical protein